MRTLLIVFIAVVLLGAGVALAAGFVQTTQPAAPTSTAITFQEDNRASRLNLVLQQPQYAYQNDQLVRLDKGNSLGEVLVAKTPLVAPGGLFLSPDGSKLAYFLDNIHDQKQQLTELWYLDTETGQRHLLVEKLRRPDVLTTPRWNSSSTHLWFVANSGSNPEEKIEFVVVAVSPANLAARFNAFDWKKNYTDLEQAQLDISFTGRSLALARAASPYRTDLTVIHDGSLPQVAVVRGALPFLKWLPSGEVVYAVQDDSGLALWRLKSTQHTFAARLPGELEEAKSDPAGEFMALVMREGKELTWSAWQVKTGLVFPKGLVHSAGLKPASFQVLVTEPEASPPAASTLPALEAAEMAAFIDNHLVKISGEPTAQPLRIITTSEPNVVYVDFRVNTKEDRRLLLTIRDAIHPEWSIRARYEPAAGEWRKSEGGGIHDPTPQNVYEWEKDVNQWILKSSQ